MNDIHEKKMKKAKCKGRRKNSESSFYATFENTLLRLYIYTFFSIRGRRAFSRRTDEVTEGIREKDGGIRQPGQASLAV